MGRKEEILEAAKERFFRYGYKKTTLEEVAGDVGMVKSALYKHYTNKEALFQAVIDYMSLGYMTRAIEVMRRSSSGEDRIRGLLHEGAQFIYDHLKEYKPNKDLWNELRPYIMLDAADHYAQFESFLAQAITEGIEQGELSCTDPVKAARIIHMMVDSIDEKMIYDQLTIGDVKRLLDFAVDMLISGLKRRGE